ncbi:MAG: adenosylcobinamide-GDP ribazoletransferase [Halobacteriales archaeon]
MVLRVRPRVAALRGAIAFLTRIPVGHGEQDWERFRERPGTMLLAGYLLGVALVPALLLPLPAATAAIVFAVWLYVLAGINHVDGLADLGDALVVHGDPDHRRTVMQDTTAGVGAVLVISLAVVGLVLGGFRLAAAPIAAVGVILAAEVGAKLSMATVVCFGSAAFDGLGAQLTERAGHRSFLWPAVLALPAGVATWPNPAAAVAILAAVLVAALMLAWGRRNLGGVNGDIMGATNEIARVVAIHAGVLVWTLS